MKRGNLTLVSVCITTFWAINFPLVKSFGIDSAHDFQEFSESDHQDFVVNFKGETVSLKNLTKLLRLHNVTLPQEERYFAEVFKQKNNSEQSCAGRCYRDERGEANKCFCDEVCKTLGDCCVDFYSRCHQSASIIEVIQNQNVTCGDVISHGGQSFNEPPWSGIIMKSSCSLSGSPVGEDCKAVKKLNMTLMSELPVFGWKHNVTYRNIACARCNNEEKMTFWELQVKCGSGRLEFNGSDIKAVRTFVMDKINKCSWKYETSSYQTRHCVLHDTICAVNKQPWMSLVKDLCSSYSMPFSVDYQKAKVSYKNPHCALCDPEGHSEPATAQGPGIPWSIILDVSGNFRNPETPKTPQPTGATKEKFNVTAQMLHCTSNGSHCTITINGKTCKAFIPVKNQSAKINASLDKHHVMIQSEQFLDKKIAMDLNGSTVYVLCPDDKATNDSNQDFTVLIYITVIGTTLSIISLCFLLFIYMFFKELRNLPGKCLINICGALLCYQIIFFTVEKANEVDALCKAVAISLHFFILAAFSWMSIMAFNTANAFTVKAGNARRQSSNQRKTFIKYCILGWGLPVVVVGLFTVLDFTGSFHVGYGKSNYCWIFGNTAMIVAMVTPVSLALVFNITCLAKNLYGIHQLQKGASLAANNSKASLTLICIKLTTVMGLTWILGLAANWKQTEFLHYPSTVLNCMQGFFIALCFTTSKRVRGLLKERFYRGKGLKCAAEPQSNGIQDQSTVRDGDTSADFNRFSFASMSTEQLTKHHS